MARAYREHSAAFLDENSVHVHAASCSRYAADCSRSNAAACSRSMRICSEDNQIACRHLATAFLLDDICKKNKGYLYREQFRTQAGMLENKSLRENFYDKDMVPLSISSYHLLPKIDGNALGLGLAQACEGMKAGEEKKFLFQSENHMMAIIVRLKEKKDTGLLHYSVKFFDPNSTLMHRRFDIHKDLSKIQLRQCLPIRLIGSYFNKIKGSLLQYSASERIY